MTTLLVSALFGWCLVAVVRAQDTDGLISEAKRTPVQVGGSWVGSDTQSGADGGSGPMTLDLVQSKRKLTGVFMVTVGGGTPTGPLNGTIEGDAIHATFHTTSGINHPCPAEVAAVVDGNEMTGTFAVHGSKKHCSQSTGTFSLTRR